jgi:hypothetical protein
VVDDLVVLALADAVLVLDRGDVDDRARRLDLGDPDLGEARWRIRPSPTCWARSSTVASKGASSWTRWR